jgi:3-oxoacyl-[acyl-carrier protein] reductase
MTTEKGIALVTGASRGIGAEIAAQLAKAGWNVIGTATTDAGAEAISARLAGSGGRGITLNVTDTAAVDAALDSIAKTDGAIEVLVHNAGITRDNLLLRMKEDEWDSVIETNLTAVARLTQRVLKGMTRARKGRIILVGSVVGSMGNAGQTNYAAAKAGLGGFARSLAREVGSRNITVNMVAPGFIDTDMTRTLPEEARNRLVDGIALKRLGDVADVASAVVFLAGPAAGYITGETLHINGGLFMH